MVSDENDRIPQPTREPAAPPSPDRRRSDAVERGFRQTFDFAPVGMAQVSLDGRWLVVNQKLCEIVRYSHDELIQLTFQDITYPEDLEQDLFLLEQLAAAEIPSYSIEKRYVRKDGSLVWVNSTVSLVRDENGAPEHAVSVVEDISERKESEARLRYLSALVESSDDAILGKTLGGTITSWNKGAERLYGYTAAEIIGKSVFNLFVPEHVDGTQELMVRVAEGNRVEAYETVRRRKDGTRFDVSLSMSPIYDESGDIIGISSIARDITRQKQIERELRDSEQRFRELFNQIPISAAILDPESLQFLQFNDTAARNLGYTREEFAKLSVFDIEAKMSPGELRSIERRPEIVLETQHRTKTGEVRDVIVHGRQMTIEGRHVTNSVWLDVTESKRARDEIIMRERQLATVLESLPVGVAICDSSGKLVMANAAMDELWGTKTPLVEISEYNVFKGYHPGTMRPVQSHEWALARAITNGEKVSAEEYEIVTFDGKNKTMLNSALPIRDSEGHVTGAIAVNVDITERKRMERELVHAKQAAETSLSQFRATVDGMSEGVLVCAANGTPLLANPALIRMYGLGPEFLSWSPKKIVSELEISVIGGKPLPVSEWPLSRALRGYEVRGQELSVRVPRTGKDMIVSYNASPIRDPNGEIVMAVITVEDITAQKKAERLLIQTEKLASAGRLAATIAHEINNPLEAVMNCIYLATLDKAISQETREQLRVAEVELQRAAHITRQTLGFYRDTSAPKRTDIAELVDTALALFVPRLRSKNVKLEREYTGEAFAVGVASELRQVVSNLLANAIDAVPQGGNILLRVSNCSLNGRGKFVRITVCDNGAGIDPMHRQRIFEPFFTTKDAIGTGLGLWVSKQIMDKHHGNIRVKSRPSGGTVFALFLPASEPVQEKA